MAAPAANLLANAGQGFMESLANTDYSDPVSIAMLSVSAGGAAIAATIGGAALVSDWCKKGVKRKTKDGLDVPDTDVVVVDGVSGPVDPEEQRRAFEAINFVLRNFGSRLAACGIISMPALQRALANASAHIEVSLFSPDMNAFFSSLSARSGDEALINSVFASAYLLGALTAEVSQTLPEWKGRAAMGSKIIQQFFRQAVGEDAFKQSVRGFLRGFDTLAATAGLLRPTDIGYASFPGFPTFSPSRYSSRRMGDRHTNKGIYEKLIKHFTKHGFPQPHPSLAPAVGPITDWRFLSGASNTRTVELEKADKAVGENFGKVLHWLTCDAERMPPGMAVIAYYDQHISLTTWLGTRCGCRVLRANRDLDTSSKKEHAKLDKKLRAVFETWVLVVPDLDAAGKRARAESMAAAAGVGVGVQGGGFGGLGRTLTGERLAHTLSNPEPAAAQMGARPSGLQKANTFPSFDPAAARMDRAAADNNNNNNNNNNNTPDPPLQALSELSVAGSPPPLSPAPQGPGGVGAGPPPYEGPGAVGMPAPTPAPPGPDGGAGGYGGYWQPPPPNPQFHEQQQQQQQPPPQGQQGPGGGYFAPMQSPEPQHFYHPPPPHQQQQQGQWQPGQQPGQHPDPNYQHANYHDPGYQNPYPPPLNMSPGMPPYQPSDPQTGGVPPPPADPAMMGGFNAYSPQPTSPHPFSPPPHHHHAFEPYNNPATPTSDPSSPLSNRASLIRRKAPPPPKPLRTARVLFDFSPLSSPDDGGGGDEELAVKQGEVVEWVPGGKEEEDGWVRARVRGAAWEEKGGVGRWGLVPMGYLEGCA